MHKAVEIGNRATGLSDLWFPEASASALIAIAKFAANPRYGLFIFPCQNNPCNKIGWGWELQRQQMSKMNFAYNPPEAAKPEVRLHLLTLGYFVLAAVVAWMITKPYLG
jgi:hypothetical protein